MDFFSPSPSFFCLPILPGCNLFYFLNWSDEVLLKIILEFLIHIHIYQPLHLGRIWHKVNFLVEFNKFEFRLFLLLDNLPHQERWTSLPYYLPIAGRRIIGSISFPRVFVLCESQSASSRIWTCIAVFVSYDDNHYTTGTSLIHINVLNWMEISFFILMWLNIFFLYIYIYIYIYMKTGNKSDAMKMYKYKKHQIFLGWFYF